MDLDDYQKKASETNRVPKDDATFHLMFLAMGLAGETGEAIEKVKKIVRNDKGVITDEKREGLKGEIGDVLWYLSQLAETIGVTLNAAAEKNLAKLADRAKRGEIESEGDDR